MTDTASALDATIPRKTWREWDDALVRAIKARRAVRNEIDGMAAALRAAFPEIAPND